MKNNLQAIVKKFYPKASKNRIAIEAGVKQGWERYLGEQGKFIGMDSFGASAPAIKLFEHYGITEKRIVELASGKSNSD